MPRLLLFSLLVLVNTLAAGEPMIGATTIATWRHDREAALLLLFDDGSPTHWTTAIPELRKRGLTGTFYLVPGASWHQTDPWIDAARDMSFGNHTFTHRGAATAMEAESDIARATAVLRTLPSASTQRSFLSFARPGGVEWAVSQDEMTGILERQSLITRPASAGRFGGMHLTSAEALIGVIDGALRDGGLERLMFHGIGGDWHAVATEDFIAALDSIVAQRERLWVTDPVSAALYTAERAATRIDVITADAGSIRLHLDWSLDPRRYDEPLTLVTVVPATTARYRVALDGDSALVTTHAGVIRYDVRPGTAAVLISPAE